tara:strand:+ start:86 stop:721 length:636 start_codon:yes stop_codon:yes gene_type:complete
MTNRKGPSESATKFKKGTKKRGNNGNMWIIATTSSGTQRWQKINVLKKKNSTKKTKKTKKTKNTIANTNDLKQLKKKYSVSINGSKKKMANGLWTVRGDSMSSEDIQYILPMLDNINKNEAEKLLQRRNTNVITNYKKMWKPMPKPLNQMTREEIIKELRSFRNAWEKITTRSMDLSDMRLGYESLTSLKSLLKHYYSDESKLQAEEWLRK